MYEVHIEKAAERDLKKLEATVFHKIVNVIKQLRREPRPAGCRKLVGSLSDWRIQVSNYRVIYEIDERDRAVRIMRVRHRREVYR